MKNNKILVVEDDTSTRRLEQIILQREGYEILEAASAEEAIEILAGTHVDIILIDIILPGMSGIELLHTPCDVLAGN